MTFEAEGTLNITVPQRQLDNVSQQIEDAVGTTEVGLTDGGSMSAQTAGAGGGRARRRARRSYRMEETRTDLLEDAVAYLEEIEDKVGGGDGGAGGVVNELIGATVETGGDAAIEGGSMLADLGIETLGTSIGSTVGSAVSDAISGNSVSVSEPSWTPLTVEEPEPIGVEDPPQAGFKSEPGPIGFKDLPGPVGFEELPGPVEFESLPGPVAVEEVEPLPVEDVGPIDVEVTVNTPGGGASTTASSGSGSLTRGTGGTGNRDGGETQSMLDMMYEGMGRGGPFGALVGASGYGAKVLDSGTDAGPIVDGDERGILQMADAHTSNPTATKSGGSSGAAGSTGGAATTTVNVDVSPRIDAPVEPDAQSIAGEVVAEVEKALGDVVDELGSDMQDAEQRLDKLERALRRNR